MQSFLVLFPVRLCSLSVWASLTLADVLRVIWGVLMCRTDREDRHKAGARGPRGSALLPLWCRAITVIVWRLPVLSVKLESRLCADGGDGAEYKVWKRWGAAAWILTAPRRRRRNSGKQSLSSNHEFSFLLHSVFRITTTISCCFSGELRHSHPQTPWQETDRHEKTRLALLHSDSVFWPHIHELLMCSSQSWSF